MPANDSVEDARNGPGLLPGLTAALAAFAGAAVVAAALHGVWTAHALSPARIDPAGIGWIYPSYDNRLQRPVAGEPVPGLDRLPVSGASVQAFHIFQAQRPVGPHAVFLPAAGPDVTVFVSGAPIFRPYRTEWQARGAGRRRFPQAKRRGFRPRAGIGEY